jgi:hypothetical protein
VEQEKFKYFLTGVKFKLITEHKPLLEINRKKEVDCLEPRGDMKE